MKRRGFLKAVAALLPAAALGTRVESQVKATEAIQADTPQPSLAKDVLEEAGLRATCKTPRLKPDHMMRDVSCKWFCDDVAQRGCVVELDSFVEGNSQWPVVRPGHHTGQPVGVLMDDVVDLDLCKVPLWNHRGTQKGGKVTVLQEGEILTGPFEGTVKVGSLMYYDENGGFTTENNGHPIGYAMSGKDDDGYVKVAIRLYLNEGAEYE